MFKSSRECFRDNKNKESKKRGVVFKAFAKKPCLFVFADRPFGSLLVQPDQTQVQRMVVRPTLTSNCKQFFVQHLWSHTKLYNIIKYPQGGLSNKKGKCLSELLQKKTKRDQSGRGSSFF